MMDDEIVFESMIRRRTKQGQFAKGHSGNPFGRPRTKHQRAASTRQSRRDVLAVTEELVPVKTAAGVQMMPYHLANLHSMRQRAAQGHAPTQRYLDKLHRDAIREHEEANPRLARLLENTEVKAVEKSVDALPKWEWQHLNIMRKFSWRI